MDDNNLLNDSEVAAARVTAAATVKAAKIQSIGPLLAACLTVLGAVVVVYVGWKLDASVNDIGTTTKETRSAVELLHLQPRDAVMPQYMGQVMAWGDVVSVGDIPGGLDQPSQVYINGGERGQNGDWTATNLDLWQSVTRHGTTVMHLWSGGESKAILLRILPNAPIESLPAFVVSSTHRLSHQNDSKNAEGLTYESFTGNSVPAALYTFGYRGNTYDVRFGDKVRLSESKFLALLGLPGRKDNAAINDEVIVALIDQKQVEPK